MQAHSGPENEGLDAHKGFHNEYGECGIFTRARLGPRHDMVTSDDGGWDGLLQSVKTLNLLQIANVGQGTGLPHKDICDGQYTMQVKGKWQLYTQLLSMICTVG